MCGVGGVNEGVCAMFSKSLGCMVGESGKEKRERERERKCGAIRSAQAD